MLVYSAASGLLGCHSTKLFMIIMDKTIDRFLYYVIAISVGPAKFYESCVLAHEATSW